MGFWPRSGNYEPFNRGLVRNRISSALQGITAAFCSDSLHRGFASAISRSSVRELNPAMSLLPIC